MTIERLEYVWGDKSFASFKCPACNTGLQGYGFTHPWFCSGVRTRWLFFKVRDALIPHLHFKCWNCGFKYLIPEVVR